MAEVLPLSESELQILESLLRHKIRFLVVGLSAAALQGAPVVTEDVDLWFENLTDSKLSLALKKVKAAYVPPFELNPPMISGLGSEPFDIVIRMDGLGKFADEWKKSLKIKVGRLLLKVLPLERILISKQAANRPKDKRILGVLQTAVRTAQTKTKPARQASSPRARQKKATSK